MNPDTSFTPYKCLKCCTIPGCLSRERPNHPGPCQGHEWYPRPGQDGVLREPRLCPKCHTTRWDQPKVTK